MKMTNIVNIASPALRPAPHVHQLLPFQCGFHQVDKNILKRLKLIYHKLQCIQKPVYQSTLSSVRQ